MDVMEEDYDGPQDLESTVQEIDALYEEVIPPSQETLRVIQGATATVGAPVPVGNNSVLLRLLAMFRLQLSATNVLVFGDREGQDHGFRSSTPSMRPTWNFRRGS